MGIGKTREGRVVPQPILRVCASSSALLRDGVEKSAGDVAAPAACRADRLGIAVGEQGQGLVVSGLDQPGVMEFVPAQYGVGGAERTVSEHARLAIAEMQLAFGKARRKAEKARHGVA